MSRKELQRAEILSQVKVGSLSLADAAERLQVSYRQAKRLWRRYGEGGAEALKHRNAGRVSNRARPAKERKRILALVRKKYGGDEATRFGPTLAAEHLASEEGITIDAETLRRRMLAEGLWSRERKSRQHRRRRQRKEHFGELLQLDGSFHNWLEERAGRGCLINLVDDATGRALAWFAEEETTWAVADVLRAWVEKHGIPRAIYTDWKSVYHAPSEGEDREPRLSQFGRMCAKLGIELIAANSPQAKGRVERSHGTHQDRLVKKMRLLGIRDYETANAYLRKTYLPAHNKRFAIAPAQRVDFHDPVRGDLDLDSVFCLECERTVSNDWVIRYNNRLLQLEGTVVTARAVVRVQERRNGSLRVLWREEELRWQEIAGGTKAAPVRKVRTKLKVQRPAAEHPWRRERAVASRA